MARLNQGNEMNRYQKELLKAYADGEHADLNNSLAVEMTGDEVLVALFRKFSTLEGVRTPEDAIITLGEVTSNVLKATGAILELANDEMEEKRDGYQT
jgi:hypothetical protein